MKVVAVKKSAGFELGRIGFKKSGLMFQGRKCQESGSQVRSKCFKDVFRASKKGTERM